MALIMRNAFCCAFSQRSRCSRSARASAFHDANTRVSVPSSSRATTRRVCAALAFLASTYACQLSNVRTTAAMRILASMRFTKTRFLRCVTCQWRHARRHWPAARIFHWRTKRSTVCR